MRTPILAISILLLAAASAHGNDDPEVVRAEVESIDASLRQQKWKPAKKRAQKLAGELQRGSWYAKDLDKTLSELAFQQAVALANLGDRDDALWYWAIAQNLDFRIVRKDLEPYSEAGKLLREFPLRTPGTVPAGFRIYPQDGNDRAPGMPKLPVPKILSNTGATIDRPGDFAVEIVIDEKGEMHHPVVISTHLHPVIVYFVLESMLDFPRFEPAQYEREPVDCLFDLTIKFQIQRWGRRG